MKNSFLTTVRIIYQKIQSMLFENESWCMGGLTVQECCTNSKIERHECSNFNQNKEYRYKYYGNYYFVTVVSVRKVVFSSPRTVFCTPS